MLNLLSKKIVKKLIKDDIISANHSDIYIYGFSLIISNFIGILSVILISAILKSIFKGLCFLVILISLRIHTGGYHAKNYLTCNLVLIFSFVFCFYVSHLYTVTFLYHFVFFILMSIVVIFIPIENKNKPILKKKRIYKFKSIILYIIYYTCGILTLKYDLIFGKFILKTLDFTLFMVLFEIIRRRLFDE